MSDDSKCVIRICDPPFWAGQYLMRFDVAAHDGRVQTPIPVWPDTSEAAVFDDVEAALEYWRTPSTVVPLRGDGMPNRPLTAFTVEIISLRDARDDKQ